LSIVAGLLPFATGILAALLPVIASLLPFATGILAALLPVIASLLPVATGILAALLPIIASLLPVARGQLFAPASASQAVTQCVAPLPDRGIGGKLPRAWPLVTQSRQGGGLTIAKAVGEPSTDHGPCTQRGQVGTPSATNTWSCSTADVRSIRGQGRDARAAS
jgi:hypothetical protein